jgi:hypothetical protein
MNTETKKCECGRIWSLKRVKMPHGNRDDDSIRCPCGRIVKEWNGGHTWTGNVLPGEKSKLPPSAIDLSN